jgi:holliday junction DNA helicase RuvA
VQGVGKRTAERIVAELRPKFGGDDPITITRGESDDTRTLARDGLLELGYTPQEADRLLDGASGDRPEDLIAHALKAARP